MSGLVLIRSDSSARWDHPLRDVEVCRDPDEAVTRIANHPGKTGWVAIAPGVEDPNGIAGQIRNADPRVAVVLLGAEAATGSDSDSLPEILSAVLEGAESATALAALHREKTYVRTLLHTADAAIALIGQDGTVREWNRRMESLFGVSREEALGRPYGDFIVAEDLGRVAEDMQRLLAGGEPSEGFETAVTTPDGIRNMLWNVSLVDDERGEPAFLTCGVDLTIRESADKALRESHRRALEGEKLAAITALTGGIAHDIGTPMTAILGYAELLSKSVGDEKNRKRATTIVEQVHRVSELIDTLLNLARMEERPLIPLDLAGVLDKALDVYRERFSRRGIVVERDDRPTPMILGDPGRLHRLLLSVFFTALEAMPEGGTLRLSLGEADDADAEIRISDTGPGLDPALQERVVRAVTADDQQATGAGLGLLLARTIVEEHRGEMAIASGPDLGTEFRFSFPPFAEETP